MTKLWLPGLAGSSPDPCFLRDGVILILLADGSSCLLDFDGDFYRLSQRATRILVANLELGCSAAAEAIALPLAISADDAARASMKLIRRLKHLGLLVTDLTDGRRMCHPLRKFVARFLHATSSIRFGSRPRGIRLLLCSAWASMRIAGFGTTVEQWVQSNSASDKPFRSVWPSENQLAELVCESSLRLPLEISCKERALCVWRLVREAGIPAGLILGIDIAPFQAHFWCSSIGGVIGDDPEYCARFTPVFDFSLQRQASELPL